MAFWQALDQTLRWGVVILFSFGVLILIELWRIGRAKKLEDRRAGR
ncbi:MAG: hypothetical protein WC722_05775 [Rhodospirillales bacterium]|jgi:hypothetical protein